MSKEQEEARQQILLAQSGESRLVLITRGRDCSLAVLDSSSEVFREIACRMSTLCDAGDGMTVHLAGGGALCSIGAIHSVVHFEISGAREEPELRFSIPQPAFQSLLARIVSAAATEA